MHKQATKALMYSRRKCCVEENIYTPNSSELNCFRIQSLSFSPNTKTPDTTKKFPVGLIVANVNINTVVGNKMLRICDVFGIRIIRKRYIIHLNAVV
jgi:hypothetical protein